jgi:hypothetical protein
VSSQSRAALVELDLIEEGSLYPPGCLARVVAVAPPPSPAGAAVSCPHLDRRLRLEREIPLCVLNRGRRSENRQLSFNEILWTRGPAVVDPIYGPWTYSTDFSLQK